MAQGISKEEFLNIIDEPVSRSDKYSYQIVNRLDRIIELLENKKCSCKEELAITKVEKPKQLKGQMHIEEIVEKPVEKVKPAPKKRTTKKGDK